MKKYLVLLLSFIFLLTVSTVSEQYLTNQIQSLLQSPSESHSSPLTLWALALTNVFIDLFINMFMILLFAFHLRKTDTLAHLEDSARTAAQYLGEHFQQLIIEQLRVMGSILLWFLLFIIPGLWRFVQLVYVPFVVLFDHEYKSGHRDALETSKRVFYKAPLQTLCALLLIFVLWPLLSTLFFDEYLIFSQYPLQAFFIVCLEAGLTLIGLLVLYKIFSKSRRSLNGINV